LLLGNLTRLTSFSKQALVLRCSCSSKRVSKGLKSEINILIIIIIIKNRFIGLTSLNFLDHFLPCCKSYPLKGYHEIALTLNLDLEMLKAVQPDLNKNAVTKHRGSQ
jgi:hypothetical protein